MRRGADFAGRSVAITGAAGGIGSALAQRFGRDGARLGLLDLDRSGLHALASDLARQGIDSVAVECDVTSLEDCRRSIARLIDTHGGIDVLVNNAGITHLSPFSETEVEVIRRVMEVNFFGAVNCTKAALDSLLERRGRIAVLSSVAGFAPLATRSGYSASKHALHGFFDSLRAELRARGVTVTVVCPFFVKTGIGDRALGGDGGTPRMARTQTGTPAEPRWLADEIHRALRKRRRLLVPSRGAKLSYLVSRLAPASFERIMARRIMQYEATASPPPR